MDLLKKNNHLFPLGKYQLKFGDTDSNVMSLIITNELKIERQDTF